MARRKSARINGKNVDHKVNRTYSREVSDSSTVDLMSSTKPGRVGRKSKLQVPNSQQILGDLAILGDEPAAQNNYVDWHGLAAVPVQKHRAAPRSGDQFRVGPDFQPTRVNRAVIVTSRSEEVVPTISSRIDRGFDLMAGSWVGYKRNYFSLVCSFQFDNHDPSLWNERFHICDDHGRKLNIKCFALRLLPRCYEEDISVILVQHTAKRDKGPQFQPPVYPAVCGELPSHEVIKQSSNIRNREKIKAFDNFCYLSQETVDNAPQTSILKTYPEGRIAKVANYQRIQFSTSNLYKKPSVVHKHFLLKVELVAVLDDSSYTIVAYSESPPLIVRGRSPANYEAGVPPALLVPPRPPPIPEYNWRHTEPRFKRLQLSGINHVMHQLNFENDTKTFDLYRDIPTSSSDNVLDPEVLESSSFQTAGLDSNYDMALILADRENAYYHDRSEYNEKLDRIHDQENYGFKKYQNKLLESYHSPIHDSPYRSHIQSPSKLQGLYGTHHRHRHRHHEHKRRHRSKRSSSDFERFREELERIENEVV